jgi:hypothetical protein
MKRLALLACSAVAAIGWGAVGATSLDPEPPPHSVSVPCRVTVRAYEDGSASLYCEGEAAAFGRIDAESGRVRISTRRDD